MTIAAKIIADSALGSKLADLTRAKAVFQQRALLAVLNEGQRHPPVMATDAAAPQAGRPAMIEIMSTLNEEK